MQSNKACDKCSTHWFITCTLKSTHYGTCKNGVGYRLFFIWSGVEISLNSLYWPAVMYVAQDTRITPVLKQNCVLCSFAFMMVKRVPVENGESNPPLPFVNLFPFVLHNDLNKWRKTDINQTLLPVQTLVVSDLCLSTELVQLLNQTESIAGAAIIAHRLQDTVHLTPVLPHGCLQFLECFLYVLNYFSVYITSWRKL